MTKERMRSFPENGKEPIIERIFSLVDRYPSRNEAAKAWGINLNTLQNYYKRKHLSPSPRKNLLLKIAEHEGISLEWLLYGKGEPPKEHIKSKKELTNVIDEEQKLFGLLSILTANEKRGLFEILARKGVETVLYLLDEDNIRLLQLDQVVKAKILGMQSNAALNAERAKECGSDSEEEASSDSLTGNHKQAI